MSIETGTVGAQIARLGRRTRRRPGSGACRWRRGWRRTTTSTRHAGGSTSPWVRSLDGPWQLPAAPLAGGRLAGRRRRRATADDEWDEVAVPGSWVLPADGSHDRGTPIYLNVRMPFAGQAPFVPADNPTGVYRRTFSVPARWRRRRTLLRVGAANSMGFVWVNGEFVGFGTDSHLASTFDITAHLRRRTQLGVHRRAALERVDVGRGPGPVVDAGVAPQRRVGLGATRRPRRHGDGAWARCRRHDGNARPRRRSRRRTRHRAGTADRRGRR